MTPWEDDELQFARLLQELDGAGAFTPRVMKYLRESMDLENSDIMEIVDRATARYDRAVAEIPRRRR